jgi:putative ATP-binding cassette transporter
VGFYKALWGFASLIMVAAPLFAVTDFVEDRLKVEWRGWLTKKMLNSYYSNRSFYKLHQCNSSLDNPDQVLHPSPQHTHDLL